MAAYPQRHLLAGVPRVEFYKGGPRCPEDIPFPAVMRALTEYLGDRDLGCRSCRGLEPGCKIPCSYAHFIGVSGVASFLSWKPGWEMDNVEIMYMSDDPAAPFDRAFEAAGYATDSSGSGAPGQESEESCRSRIMASIQEGKPVLAFGPIGPPESALVTGYDEGGDVLIGWSFFQDMPEFNAGVEFEPTGEFRKRDWFDYAPGFSFITIGRKQERPSLAEIYRKALAWMLQVARTPKTFGDRATGLAAYDAWADQLLRDEEFPDDEAVLRQRHDVHNNVVGLVAEARWYGSLFLIEAGTSDYEKQDFCRTEDLLRAAACYAAEHALMWRLWDLVGGNGNPDAYRRFADPAVRREMALVIRKAKEKSAQAAEHIEAALAKG